MVQSARRRCRCPFARRWERLLAGAPAPGSLRYDDIPWPPRMTGILAGYAAWLQQRDPGGPAAASRSAAFHEAFKQVGPRCPRGGLKAELSGPSSSCPGRRTLARIRQ
jgi:hypothetical protein